MLSKKKIAERTRFELVKRFWRLHAFQACLFNHSSTSPNNIPQKKQRHCCFLAEREGFEPAKHFWRLHAFQACLFNHSSISPRAFSGYPSEIGCKLQRISGIASDFSYKCILFFRHTILYRKQTFNFFLNLINFKGLIGDFEHF